MLLKKIDCFDLNCYKGGGGKRVKSEIKGYKGAESYLASLGLSDPSKYSFDLSNSNPIDNMDDITRIRGGDKRSWDEGGGGMYTGEYKKGWTDRMDIAKDSIEAHIRAKHSRDSLADPKSATADVNYGGTEQPSTGFEDFITTIDSGEATSRGEINSGLGENIGSIKSKYTGLGI